MRCDNLTTVRGLDSHSARAGFAQPTERSMFEDDDGREYVVVLNDEEQYSIWPTDRPIPDGWYDAGCRGTKDECLAHISEVWVDMRPRSLRLKMEQAGQ